MTYLKSKQHYIDLYDRHTVEECRRFLSRAPGLDEIKKDLKDKKLDEKEGIRVINAANNLYIYFRTGERYAQKEEVIKKWMDTDKARDDFFEAAKAPEEIACLTCGRLMYIESKDLFFGIDDKPDRVLFMYECPLKHVPRRAFYDDGEEFRRDKPKCPKCKTEVIEEHKDTVKKLTTFITCPNCGYKDKDEYELSTKSEEPKLDSNYEEDRLRFCLSEKDGQEFMHSMESFKQMGQLMDKIKEKEKHQEDYAKVAKLKKLKIIELEALLAPILEKAGYIKLQFKTPEVAKDIILPFVVYEQRSDREGRASTYDLERLLRKTLRETNWRLMTDGTSYRLGMLEGRLHGYDREEDLLKLVSD